MPFPMLSTVHHAIGTRDLLIADGTNVLICHSVANSHLGKLCAQISELEDENIIVYFKRNYSPIRDCGVNSTIAILCCCGTVSCMMIKFCRSFQLNKHLSSIMSVIDCEAFKLKDKGNMDKWKPCKAR